MVQGDCYASTGLTMKTCTKCREDKLREFFYKRKASNDGLSPICKLCQNQDNKKWNEKNHEKIVATQRKWRENNPEKQRELERQYRKNNPEKRYISCKTYRQKNKNLVNAWASMRRSVKVLATPNWANHQKIQEFYDTADGLSMITGEFYEVDHIVPLISNVVCGLHSEHNLRVITRSENRSKGNKHIEIEPCL